MNDLVSSHVITLEADDAGKVTYCGGDIKNSKMRILFDQKNLGVCSSNALEDGILYRALDEASVAAGEKIGFTARRSIAKDYDGKIGEVEKGMKDVLGKPIKFSPNFEDIYSKLQAEIKKPKSNVPSHWEEYFGHAVLDYFEGVKFHLKIQMMQWKRQRCRSVWWTNLIIVLTVRL
jgi:hypothetical protein